MDLDRWDAWLERVILGLVAGALGFAVLAFGGVRLGEFLVVEALVAVAAIVWLVRVGMIRSHRLLWPPVSWGVLAFAAWAVWRSLEADLPYVAWGTAPYSDLHDSVFVVVNNLHRQDTAHGLTWFLVGLATLLAFMAPGSSPPRATASVGSTAAAGVPRQRIHVCPNHFAGLLEP
jgi:hypothetical protein